MTELQNRILADLMNAGGDYLTGESLAEKYGVTRSAVWKAVKALKSSGLCVDARTNRGYRMQPKGALSAEKISGYLKAKDFYDIRYQRVVTSTNTILKEFAAKGAPEGTVLAASEQTGGRGRFGRTFISRPDTGIYLSFILRPDGKINDPVRITAIAAVAAAEAIDETAGVSTSIKWVNDIYLGGRKIAGILTEGAFDLESGRFDSVVVGIGVNILPPTDLPQELRDIVGSVYDSRQESDEADAPSRVTAAILDRFFEIYTSHSADYMETYKKKNLVTGRDVTVYRTYSSVGDTGRKAIALDIDDEARLLVRYIDGTEEWLSSGEISVRL